MYYAQLDRFGYTLALVSDTEQNARRTMLDEYIKTYLKRNDGMYPSPEELQCASDELYIERIEYNEILWL